MKAAAFAVPFFALAAIAAPAQERPPQERPAQLEIIIGEAPRASDAPRGDDRRQPGAGGAAGGRETGGFERCVDVVIGSEKSFGCLNEKLKLQVNRINPPVTNTPPIDARSQDIKVGVVNVPAVQQQYGSNFGASAFPFRPPPPVFSTPSVPTVHR